MTNKFLGIILIIAIIGIFIACDGDPKPDPTCSEACNEEADEDGYKYHLGLGDDGKVVPCTHGDKTIQGDCNCKEQTATLNVGTIKVTKAANVSFSDFNAIITELNIVASTEALSETQIANFKTNFPKVHITSRTGISHDGNVLTVGCDEDSFSIFDYLVTDNSLV